MSKAIMKKNTITKKTPIYLSSHFCLHDEVLTYNLRNAGC